MAAECIHGLMVESCDVCSPKAPPERPRASRVRPPAPRREVRERRMPASGSAPRAASRPTVVNAGAQRMFHLTHLRNLPGILAAGRLLADAAGARPVVDLSSADTRELRREVMAAGRSVAGYVPFFLRPDPTMWVRIRGRMPDLRLSEDALRLPASEFVLLVSPVRTAGEGAIVADRDAADPGTRFRTAGEPAGRTLLSALAGEGAAALGSAELLVPEEFAFSGVTLVGVANDRVRAEVRALLEPSGFLPRVSVHPPWFERV